MQCVALACTELCTRTHLELQLLFFLSRLVLRIAIKLPNYRKNKSVPPSATQQMALEVLKSPRRFRNLGFNVSIVACLHSMGVAKAMAQSLRGSCNKSDMKELLSTQSRTFIIHNRAL